MARDFNGTNEKIDFGSDASIDGFTTLTYAMWIQRDVTTVFHVLAHKEEDNTGGSRFNSTHTNFLSFVQQFDGASDGSWVTSADTVGTGVRHVAVTYDRGATTNDPTFYIDGVSQSITEEATPVGTSVSDAANSLVLGEVRGALDYDGRQGWLVYHDAILTATEINRHRWWGCAPGGPSTVKVWQPMWTTDLTNKGTSTATGTATGTTMDNASIPRVERMWGSMMGCGR